MKKFTSLCSFLGLAFGIALGGCSSAPTDMPDMGPKPDAAPTGSGLMGTLMMNQTLMGMAAIGGDLTVPAGITLTLAAGTTVTVVSGHALNIQGTLAVKGTAASPVVFNTAPGAAAWSGIAVANGGTANLAYAQINNAQVAFSAGAGTTYTVDHLSIQTSQNGLDLHANGTVTKTTYVGLGQNQSGSPVAVWDSSPSLTDIQISGGNNFHDCIIVNGATSAPQFDHTEVSSYHCAYHFNDGTNITVSNSYIHDNAYAVMVSGVMPFHFTTSNLVNNSTANIGECFGAAGAVTASGNFYGGAMAFDSTCVNQTNTSPSNTMLTSAGFRP
jgi:hypothetical protein